MLLPNFLIIGASKAGTTALFLYLRDHPEIFMPEIKEAEFFLHDDWREKLGWYESLFEDAQPARAVGEASPKYSKYPGIPGVPERIAELRPDMRLVYLVRHPIERIRSHYQHSILHGESLPPIDEAVLQDPSFVQWSSYAMQIERYLDHFPRSQLCLIRSEDLRDRRAETLRSVFTFLGVDASYSSPAHDPLHYVTGDRRITRPIVERLRRRSLYRGAARLVPLRLRAAVDRHTDLLSRPAAAEASISPSVRSRLEDALRDDVARLRAYMPAGFDGWGIA